MIDTSIIIRTKNEERWISKCLRSIKKQTYKNYEIIIVDNYSTDNTIKKLKFFDIKKVVYIKSYKPGKALNLGIKNSIGRYIVMVSSHCIPTNSKWLENLVKEIKSSSKIAGVYGRQIPMKFSSPQTKRDLLITFGLDKKIQIKDSFFHNANSIIRKDLWKKNKFNENTKNIEDRIWATKILNKGYRIIYQPNAKVYHHHGIHHELDIARSDSTLKVLEKFYVNLKKEFGRINPKDLDILTLIPFIGKDIKINGKSLLKSTLDYAKTNKYLDKIIVLTDNKNIASFCKKNGATDIVLRKKIHSKLNYGLSEVYSIYLPKIEKKVHHIDLIVSLEPNYLSRPKKLISDMIEMCLEKGFDTVIPVFEEYGVAWREQKDKNLEPKRIDQGNYPRANKEPLLISLKSIGFVTHPEILREKKLIGQRCGLYKINKSYKKQEYFSKYDS